MVGWLSLERYFLEGCQLHDSKKRRGKREKEERKKGKEERKKREREEQRKAVLWTSR